MSTCRRKSAVVEAFEWYKNGDHPDDRSGEMIQDDMTGTFYRRGEGLIVRYYRHPDVPGETLCKTCGFSMHNHGWIDTSVPEGGYTVCPGDWVVDDEWYPSWRSVHKYEFNATFDLVDA